MLTGMTTLQALILAVVEGLTEYLPVSSTGHLIITSSLMGISQESFTKDFTIIVQFGAILSVLFLYWRRFLASLTIYYKLLVAFLPAAVVGLLVKDHIDLLLGNVYVVAIALIAGGVVLLFVDKWFEKQERGLTAADSGRIDQMGYGRALGIGIIQCLAFVPGVSRAAATIIGGLSMKLTRKSAAEFSFFLAVPTLTAATGLKLLKIYKTIEPEQISLIVLGNVTSFIVGAITIKAFLGFLTRRGFFAFGVYRIVLGALILILLATGHDLQLL
jgi:undecaprenyl-diphosphatase